jgi:hypothetical protein
MEKQTHGIAVGGDTQYTRYLIEMSCDLRKRSSFYPSPKSPRGMQSTSKQQNMIELLTSHLLLGMVIVEMSF